MLLSSAHYQDPIESSLFTDTVDLASDAWMGVKNTFSTALILKVRVIFGASTFSEVYSNSALFTPLISFCS